MRAPSSLRNRIRNLMPDILEVSKFDVVIDGPSDPRRAVIRAIQHIAQFKWRPPAERRDRYSKIAALTHELRIAVQETEYADQTEMLSRWSTESSKKADAISVKSKSGGDQASAQRKALAARLAFRLLSDLYRGKVPNLSEGGAYVTLTNRLYEAATGTEDNLIRACSDHFKEIRKEYIDDHHYGSNERTLRRVDPYPYTKPGRQRPPPVEPRQPPPDDEQQHDAHVSDAIERMMREDLIESVDETIRRKPLDELLDEMLG